VYAKGCLDGSVHGDSTLFPNGCHGEDVCEQLRVVPHAAKVLEVPNEGGNLFAAVSVDLEDTSTLADVREEAAVAKNVDRRLTVKEDPMQRYEIIPGLSKSKM